MLLVDLLAFPAIAFLNQSFPWATPEFLMTLIGGCIFGQVACLIVIAGWGTRHWLYGLCAASVLGNLAYWLLITGQSWQYMFAFSGTGLAVTLSIPLFFLASAMPFYVLRYMVGWHLTSHPPGQLQRHKGIGEFFTAMAVVGALLFFARASAVVAELRDNTFWPILGSATLSMGLLSLLVVLPAAWIAWRIQPSTISIVAKLGFLAVAIVLWSIIGVRYFGSPPLTTVDGMVSVVGFTILPCCVFFSGMWALRASGLELAAYAQDRRVGSRQSIESPRSEVASPWDNAAFDAPHPTLRVKQTGPHRLAIGIFLLAILGSLIVQQVDRSRQDTELRYNRLGAELSKSGGRIVVSNRRVTSLKLGPSATDETLKKYAYLKDLSSLDLSDTRITDAAFATINDFPRLQELDLAHTNITVQALRKKLVGSHITSLNLAGTKIRAEDLIPLFKTNWQLRLNALDLSYLEWTFDELKQVAPFFKAEMSLRGYGLNDEQLVELMDIVEDGSGFQIFNIDLSDNQLTGSFLSDFTPQQRLVLGKNPVSDTAFSGALAKTILRTRELSLSDTDLTDASLAVIKSRTSLNTLTLGNGKFTEQGLLAANINGISNIEFHGKSLTGESLKSRTFYMQILDLSGSGVTNASLQQLSPVMIGSLNLSGTELTDAALPTLARRVLQNEVDLSHTKITAEGLLRGDLKNYQRVIVAAGQFSDEAVTKLRRVIKLDIGGKLE